MREVLRLGERFQEIMKIGVVDLDTSHPQAWIPIEREMGHEIVGVWDGGAVHPPEYVETFAREQGIFRVFGSLEQMASEVDAAIIHGCDWDTHVVKAEPFVRAGKGVLIDKPLAGRVSDLGIMREWARAGARITGGSSLRFCNETRDWLAKLLEERGTPHTALCGCAVDEFNYGIHAYSLLSGVMGPGIASARDLGGEGQRRTLVRWSDGRLGTVVCGSAAAYQPFHATVVTDRAVTHYQPAASALYRALLEVALPYLDGAAPPPLLFDELIEPELAAIAALQSREAGGREVPLGALGDSGYNGREFAAEYRKMRYPNWKSA